MHTYVHYTIFHIYNRYLKFVTTMIQERAQKTTMVHLFWWKIVKTGMLLSFALNRMEYTVGKRQKVHALKIYMSLLNRVSQLFGCTEPKKIKYVQISLYIELQLSFSCQCEWYELEQFKNLPVINYSVQYNIEIPAFVVYDYLLINSQLKMHFHRSYRLKTARWIF
jgi:hypothetical protein